MLVRPIKLFSYDESKEPSVFELISEYAHTGYCNVLFCGQGQSGKSNGMFVAMKRLLDLNPDWKNRVVRVYKLKEFIEVQKDDKYKIVMYDEVQRVLRNWFDKVTNVVKQVYEESGFLGKINLVTTPTTKMGVKYALSDIVHFIFECHKKRIAKDTFQYYSIIYRNSFNYLKGGVAYPHYDWYDIPNMKKLDGKLWDVYLCEKKLAYSHRHSEWNKLTTEQLLPKPEILKELVKKFGYKKASEKIGLSSTTLYRVINQPSY